MSDYPNPTNTDNLFLNPRMYWKLSAITLSAVAILGLLVNFIGGVNQSIGINNFLEFDMAHNILHVVLAAAAFVFGFTNINPKIGKLFAIIFGVVYIGLAIVGFIGGLEFRLPLSASKDLLQLEIGENLVHLVLGSWALTAGLFAKYE